MITDAATVQRLAGVVRGKYGLEFFIVTFIERPAGAWAETTPDSAGRAV